MGGKCTGEVAGRLRETGTSRFQDKGDSSWLMRAGPGLLDLVVRTSSIYKRRLLPCCRVKQWRELRDVGCGKRKLFVTWEKFENERLGKGQEFNLSSVNDLGLRLVG